MVLNDWQRGKLPYFVPPPGCMLEPKPEGDDDDDDEEEEEEMDEDVVEEPEGEFKKGSYIYNWRAKTAGVQA